MMKKFALLALFASAAFSLSGFAGARGAGVRAAAPDTGEVDVYILAGQSNAVGYADKSGLDAAVRNKTYENVLIYADGETASAKKRTLLPVSAGFGKDDNCFGPELGMAEFFSRTGRTTVILLLSNLNVKQFYRYNLVACVQTGV